MLRPSLSAGLPPDAHLLALVAVRTHNAVVITDAEGRVEWINAGFTTITGYQLADAVGRRPGEFLQGPGTDPETVALMRTRLRAGDGFRTEVLNYHKSGRAYWLDVEVQPVRDGSGAVRHFIAIEQDITERKLAEATQARLAAIVESTDDAVVSKTLNGVIESWNAGAERLFGYTATEVVGRSVTMLIPPERLDEERDILGRIRRGERVDHFETVRVAKGGRPVEISLTVSPIRDRGGRVIGASKVARDITDRRRAERALRESEARLTDAQRTARFGSWTWEPGTGRVWWSDARYELLGLDPAVTAPGADAFRAVIHPDDRHVADERLRAVLAAPGEQTHDLRVVRPDGRELWVHSRIRATRGADGRVLLVEGTDQDITERKRAEDQVARTLALRDAIFESATACVVSVDLNGTIVSYNRAAEERLGYPAAEVVGRRTPIIWHDPGEVARYAAAMSAEVGRPVPPDLGALVLRAAAGRPETNRWTFIRKDGTRFLGELTVAALRDPAGNVYGWLGITVDVTERLEAERARLELADQLAERNRALEERSRLDALQAEVGLALNRDAELPELLRASCDAILRNTGAAFVRVWTLNEPERVLELQASAGLYTHTDGGHARIPVGQFKIGRIAAARAPHLTNDVASDPSVDRAWAAREGMVAFAGHPLVCNGNLVGVLALFARSPLSAGTLATLGAAADALATGVVRKRVEAALREQEQRHRAIVESALDCIITIDRRGLVTEFNPAAERTFGHTRDAVLGRHLTDLVVPPEHRDAHDAGLERFLRTGESQILGRRLVGLIALRKGGDRFPVELTIVPTRVGGEPVFTAFCRDITAEQAAEAQRREAEHELQRAKEAAEAAARTQSQFLANMSHELRTPVAAIVGFAEVLLDPWLSAADGKRAAQTIMRSGRHLIALINDVLDLEKIEAGRLELEHTPCPLPRLIFEVLGRAEVAARDKRLDLRWTPVGRLPAVFTTDPTRLRQILDNLLANAIKFTDRRRRVELRVRLDGARLLFDVEDAGIGIASEVLARLFQPFTQADASTTRRFGGTGLGLSICRSLAELMGGTVTVRSEPGVGSCFTLAVPVAEPDLGTLVDGHEFGDEPGASSVVPGVAPPRLSGRVLLAEDATEIQAAMRYFLERDGLTVETVADGRAAVARALAGAFDVVLMDMQMPELDGYAATAELRTRGYTGAVVALTAHAMSGDEERCRRAGCNDYLAKPVNPAELNRVLSRHLRDDAHRRSRAEDAAATPPPSLPSGLEAKIAQLTANYRRSLPDKARALGAALEGQDLKRLEALAHQLRGSGGLFGALAITRAAGAVEEACRTSVSVPELGALVNMLQEECESAATAI